ncbi:hypothetical protein EAE96_007115 [Botrytis aclada]|nr:hypothetical protein EAE96_007115 [Botrytis aclada]
MSTEVAEPLLWCHSESAYLASITIHVADRREVALNSRSAVYQMRLEQAKHHLGGVAFGQDPWPIRTYTIHSIEQQWRRIQMARKEAEIAREAARIAYEKDVMERKADQMIRKADRIARKEADRLAVERSVLRYNYQFILPSLVSTAPDDSETEMPAEWQQEVEEMMAPLKQKWAEEDRAKASQYQSAVAAADQVLGADFWTQCQEDADME